MYLLNLCKQYTSKQYIPASCNIESQTHPLLLVREVRVHGTTDRFFGEPKTVPLWHRCEPPPPPPFWLFVVKRVQSVFWAHIGGWWSSRPWYRVQMRNLKWLLSSQAPHALFQDSANGPNPKTLSRRPNDVLLSLPGGHNYCKTSFILPFACLWYMASLDICCCVHAKHLHSSLRRI